MKTFTKHINTYLSSFLETNNPALFEIVFEKIKSDNKEKYRKLTQYVFCIIENSTNHENQLNTLNIHFEKNIDSEEKSVIAEFIWHYFFAHWRLTKVLTT